MMQNHPMTLYITNVEKEGPFLKIWGQTNKKASADVEEALHRASPQFDEGKCCIKPNRLEVGLLCCANFADGKYYRARISSTALIRDGMVEVNFLDYGNKDIIPVVNLRSVECFNPSFISLQPLAIPFILAEAFAVGGEWDDQILEQISKELRYLETSYVIIAQAVKYHFIKASINGFDVRSHLVRKNLMQKTSIQTQEAVLLAMIPRPSPPVTQTNQSLLQYKSFTLEPNSCHEVFVSYVSDGPCHFSVQLKSYEQALTQLMKEINSIPLKPLDELPIPGTVCLAKCVEDNHICRAVVTSEVDSQYKIFYVDFGNTELVPPENLYQISFKFVIPKIMAIRLSLAGVEKSTMTIGMQCAFKQFVDNRLLMMEVLPSPRKMMLPKCRMWDPKSNTDVMDVLNRAAKFAYPDPVTLHRGFTHPVKVSFVYSCNRFYIQMKGKEDELNRLMADIQTYCNSNQAQNLTNEKEGLPCCAIFSYDNQWYRGLITKIESDNITVRYVDYGNEEIVTKDLLRVIEGKYLTVLKPQAIECALNGYQNMSEDQERDNKLEELILDQEFTMRVIDNIGGKILVDLIGESSNATISTLLLEKMVAQTKIQSPPIRKSDSKKNFEEGFRKDSSPKAFSPDNNDRRPQRSQRENSSRNSDTNSNASSESWRQDNRGFKNRKGNDWNECANNNFRKDRGNFRGRNEGRNNADRPPRFRNEHDDRWETDWKDKPQKKTNTDWGNSDPINNFVGAGNDNWDSASNDNWNDTAKTKVNPRQNKNQAKETTSDEWESSNPENDGFRRNKFERGGNRNDNEWKSRKTSSEFQSKNYQGSGDNNFKNRRDDDWNKKPNAGGDWNSEKNFKNNTDNFNKNKPMNRGGFQKKPYNKGGGSSGSEHSFGKGPRTSSRNENRPLKSGKKFGENSPDNSWNVSTVVLSEMDCASNDAVFKTFNVIGKQEKVVISWFHNPSNFFCQLVEQENFLKLLMRDIQDFYRGRPSGSCVAGAPAIALFPEDNVLYRAKILEVIGNEYKVYYVDFGNVSVVSKVWPIENKFMEMPMQALPCGLNGIEPTGEIWPSPDHFSKYFEKDLLICDFIDCGNEKFSVILSSNTDKNIGDLLVADNLAKYSETTVIDFQIGFLVGQQFRAMLTNVNDLSDFSMLLQSGFSLNCSAHNLSSATEKNEDLLRKNVNQILIVYADAFVGDKLEVTIYDPSGNKLNILSPDEGAFDTVEPLCPFLVSKSVIDGFVPHVNETSVVIQPNECTPNIKHLLEVMNEYYEKLPSEGPIIPEEEYLYAVMSKDGKWYRGRVISFNDEKASVICIDNGIFEEVPFTRLRELAFDFLQWDTQAILVNVKEPTSKFLEQNITATICYGEIGWESNNIIVVENSTVLKSSSLKDAAAPVVENIIETSSPLNETPVEKSTIQDSSSIGPAEEISSIAPIDDISSSVDQYGDSMEFKTLEEISTSLEATENCRQSVILSHIDSPNEFYIQLEDSLNAIEELQLKIQEQIEGMATLENISVGSLCAAPYSVDHQWYRSKILDADDDITTIRFIDYGNTDVINNETTKIKTLTPELLSLEVYTTKCRLKIKPIEEEWPKAASDRFEELTSVQNVKVEFVDQNEKTNFVELYSNGENVKDILIRENLALLDDVVTGEGKLTGYICHINSPSEFWIQLESCCAELEWIAEQLSNAVSFPDLEDSIPGSLCAAMYPDDEMWYRARILSNTVAGLEVLFIDYGNSCMCNNLKQLPEDLLMAPSLAGKCSLQKPEGLLNWSAEATKKFKDLAADGQTVFTIKKLTTDETSLVELFVNNRNICDKLMPNTDNGYVTEVESLESFVIKKGDIVLEDKYKLEKIPGVEYNEEMLDKFREINGEGKTLFQIEFLPTNIVRLYIENFKDIRNELKIFASTKIDLSTIETSKNTTLEDNVSNKEESENGSTQTGNESENLNDNSTISEKDTKNNSADSVNQDSLSNAEEKIEPTENHDSEESEKHIEVAENQQEISTSDEEIKSIEVPQLVELLHESTLEDFTNEEKASDVEIKSILETKQNVVTNESKQERSDEEKTHPTKESRREESTVGESESVKISETWLNSKEENLQNEEDSDHKNDEENITEIPSNELQSGNAETSNDEKTEDIPMDDEESKEKSETEEMKAPTVVVD